MAGAKKQKSHPLFFDGAGKVAGATYGMLRSNFRGQMNTATNYVASKLAVADPTSPTWSVGRSHYDVVIPDAAPSLWWDPQALWRAFDAGSLAHQRDLIVALTCYADDALSLHAGWEQTRAWARAELVEKRALAATIVLHIPSLAGSSNTPHVHVLATARQVLGWGFGPFAAETTDEGLKELAISLTEHRKRWAKGERS